MSGVEVVGLILGIIPLVVDGLSSYKETINAVGSGIRKRKTIETLCRTLTEHRLALRLLLNCMLQNSGCEIPSDDDDSGIQTMLADSDTRQAMEDYLGSHYDVLVGAFEHCEQIFRHLITKVARLVPSIKESSELSSILEANKQSEKGWSDLKARISLTFKIKDFDKDCEKLRISIDTLDRLQRLISSNHQMAEQKPSRRAKKLATALWRMRNYAEDLYLALFKRWGVNCHQSHEVKLLLEDRIQELGNPPNRIRQKQDLPVQAFRLIFATDICAPNCLWHESMVYIVGRDQQDSGCCNSPNAGSQGAAGRKLRVKINVPESKPPVEVAEEIKDICSAIGAARNNNRHLTFALTKDRRIAGSKTATGQLKPLASTARETVPLQALLQPGSTVTRVGGGGGAPSATAVRMSPKTKMYLAWTITSNFLQLLHTPWSSPRLCAETIKFLHSPQDGADLDRAFMSMSFGPCPQGAGATSQGSVASPDLPLREALVELGILLLEIWHETTLDKAYPPDAATKRSFLERRGCAFAWLEEDRDVPVEKYYQAVFHCISGSVMNVVSGVPTWDDMRFWESMCESVIVPLHSFSKSWKPSQ
ncbi:hypothetical protein HRR83_007506 [Exophiala dermatitidis]|uniref:DUF7580 domain-containing protein n=2 Tax=Exophiala dermatitidis TaxID=5970 RepID=H6C2K2_EXODN|nr:uncharacterized protein HMPREF1120_06783 [Exophiala dermatitidis NIH/UT8656]KAJ4508562.1 hypothetical protein HRR75_006383 [Exophiala dermatitidis]EHY58780.1 hypothetical protein HMPREF1120_06783 [Exophiala dermatitidis NIH/UT8656]KAJ4510480.1 hypothetical protein HRR74_006952 [Exophiala dermatitidis]KAJ4510586.1 hypothetical protein HRR73_006658 [Exophiala dermatitidis]KAJ4535092.1 hypothetical protein HRR76_006990 [Exophiala dermatitidis]